MQTVRVILVGIFTVLLLTAVVLPAAATVHLFVCHDHPDGDAAAPTYGLRIDNLLSTGIYTFSFDYADGDGSAGIILEYDDVAGTIHIYGRVYGGRDIGGSWAASDRGWADVDFWYVDHVSEQDDCGGAAGNDVYVTDESNSNAGTVSLDGWGGDQVFAFTDKKNTDGCSFLFDNDYDSKGNGGISGDPSIWHGAGWLMPPAGSARDWLFIAEMMTVPTENSTWGGVKSLYGE